ncbi:hypothetical protein BOSE62_30090 [Bosea sp. 62]|nr:hypothetical protein BOSE46_140142 [Bosea sp. 46]CAD5269164.1 hypothetical protein BOSE21B_111543 [Bosea sp. 21B]CAD5269470.1 hypothetical protein BOSE7B_20095 [Bosea sp. 7B]VVT62492.1 hypothetical protein BOS5A_80152 [Bosea sp. EC-HK365B]VXB95193.1 hypothetical protein BOSE29B_150136 [Bosea sp. 29B]VXC09441.1 hypothetical protein BOSE62_30090 [Bosea sp. 62]VXC63254.1 hypothetical protein BOSE127_30109 [Bosea sp. 127]
MGLSDVAAALSTDGTQPNPGKQSPAREGAGLLAASLG